MTEKELQFFKELSKDLADFLKTLDERQKEHKKQIRKLMDDKIDLQRQLLLLNQRVIELENQKQKFPYPSFDKIIC